MPPRWGPRARAGLADLLYLRRVEHAYRFHHALLRDVAYGRLLVADRMRIHAHMARDRADAMDPDRRAHHWWEALHPPDDAWVWTDATARAGLRAEAAAAQLPSQRISTSSTTNPPKRVVFSIMPRSWLTPTRCAHASIARAGASPRSRRTATTPGPISRVRWRSTGARGTFRLTCTRSCSGRRSSSTVRSAPRPPDDTVRGLLEEGEAVARARGDAAVLARLQMLRGMLDGDLTLASAAVRAAKDALPVADQAAMLAQLAQMQFGAADFVGMTATAARLDELADAITDPEVAVGARRRVAIWRGDLPEAHRLADELARRTRAAGPHISSHALGVQAWQAEYEGDWATARRLAGEFLALAQANEGTVFCAGGGSPVLAAGSIAEARAGRMDEARALLDRARVHEPDELHQLGTASAILGDPRRRDPAGAR